MSSNGCIATSANQTNVYKGQYAVVQTKVDVSNIEIDRLQQKLPHIVGCLRLFRMGIYSIDFTQDFAGTMLSDAICKRLQKNVQKEKTGRNCISCVEYDTRMKIYKIAPTIKAGDVRRTFGTYLADLPSCHDRYLRATFDDPRVVCRGCTRIEVSCLTPSIDRLRQDASEQVLHVVQQLRCDGLFASVSIADH